MRKAIDHLALLVALLAIGPQSSLADPPPPSFDIDFTDGSAIWNPFADFESCEDVTGVGTLCLKLEDVACDGKGSCEGDASFTFSGSVAGSTSGPASGSAKCKEQNSPNKPVCNTNLRFETEGPLQVFGLTCTSEIDGSMNGPVDSSGFLAGKANAKVCVRCPGGKRACEGAKGTFEYTLNPPAPWNLVVEVLPNGSKLEGTATDSLGFSYTARGSYSSKKDESNLSLTGDKGTESNGAKITLQKLVTTGSEVMGGTAKISVQGNQSTAELGP